MTVNKTRVNKGARETGEGVRVTVNKGARETGEGGGGDIGKSVA